MSRLIIVESPSKARTLARFLGSEYIVLASMGHVRDLPKSKIGVDVEDGFAPQYELIKGKEKQIRDLRAAVKKASSTLLAADPDREGEAIAWHLAEALGLNDPDRIVFHEITKLAVDAALAHPAQDRPLARRRAGGPPGHRPPGRIPALAAALAQGSRRSLRRTGAVGRGAPRRRSRNRDRRVRSRRVVDDRCSSCQRWQQPVQRATGRQARRHRRGRAREAGARDRGRGRRGHRRARARRQGRSHRADAGLRRAFHRRQGDDAPAAAATHDQHAAAGRELAAADVAQADHEHRPGAVRRRRARQCRFDGSDHVHAHQLDPHQRRSP